MYLVVLIVLGAIGLALMWQLHEHRKQSEQTTRPTPEPARIPVRPMSSLESDFKTVLVNARDEAEKYRAAEPQLNFTKHQHVLVVSFQRVLVDTLVTILRSHGYPAMGAYDGKDALQNARAIRPYFVLSDVVMPLMHGVELGVRLRVEDPECKVVLFSGSSTVDDLLEAASQIGFEFEQWPEPFEPKHLLDRLEALKGSQAKLAGS